MRLLVVEDDPDIADYIGQGLATMGHEAAIAHSGAAAMAACGTGSYDVVLLDRMLPDIPGLTVMNRLRNECGQTMPILILSAQGSLDERIEGLMAGADDYMTKPFEMAELNARIAAVARRGGRDSTNARAGGHDLSVGRLSLDPAAHRAGFDGADVGLNRKEYSILAFLMRHVDRVVTRAMLLEGVWNYTFEPSSNVIESNLSRLRARLECLGIDPIETRRSVGYVLRSDRCV